VRFFVTKPMIIACEKGIIPFSLLSAVEFGV